MADSIVHGWRFKDITGQRFGHLVVIDYAGKRKTRIQWRCKCDCGRQVVVSGTDLRFGSTTSCHSHKRIHLSEYMTWNGMNRRCYDPKNKQYPAYGGRGISVCDRWRNSFIYFFADMGKRPSREHSLDRIDNNSNYEPGNCWWTTRQSQGRNRRTCHYLTWNGETKTITEWAETTGLGQTAISYRIRAGWSVKRTLTTAPRCKNRLLF